MLFSLSSVGDARLTDLNQALISLADQTFEHIPASQHASVHMVLELLHQALLTLMNKAWASGSEERTAICERD